MHMNSLGEMPEMKPPHLSVLRMLGVLSTDVFEAETTRLQGDDARNEGDSDVGIHPASNVLRAKKPEVVGLWRVVFLYSGAGLILWPCRGSYS